VDPLEKMLGGFTGTGVEWTDWDCGVEWTDWNWC
jgi:hypothetical protein